MPAEIYKMFNANVYMDGSNDLAGRASEASMPAIEVETKEHSGLGMHGKLELPTGLKAMALGIKWDGFYADLLKASANPFKSHMFTFHGDVHVIDPSGDTIFNAAVWKISAKWKKGGSTSLKPQESAEFDDELSVHYCKLTYDGGDILEVDVINNIWRAGSEDVIPKTA